MKFINIMEEYGANFRKDNHTAIKLDTLINRKLMNIISQKFDFDYFRSKQEKVENINLRKNFETVNKSGYERF